VNDAAWLAEQQSDTDHPGEPIELDDTPAAAEPDVEPDEEQDVEPTRRRSAKTKYAGLLAAASALVAALSALFYAGGCSHRQPSALSDAEPAAAVKPAAAPTPAAPNADRPLPYTADASTSCPAGSTPAQNIDGQDPRNAFVCVRGGVDGQFVTIDLPKTFVVTAVALTPGWVGADASGTQQWGQHRVVTLVQYDFHDDKNTLIVQQTGDVHGAVTKAVPSVMTSRITMLIRQTSRPPAQPDATPTTPTGLPGLLDSNAAVPATPTTEVPLLGPPVDTDPVDATFAISRLTIIGHEAT